MIRSMVQDRAGHLWFPAGWAGTFGVGRYADAIGNLQDHLISAGGTRHPSRIQTTCAGTARAGIQLTRVLQKGWAALLLLAAIPDGADGLEIYRIGGTYVRGGTAFGDGFSVSESSRLMVDGDPATAFEWAPSQSS